jgi:Rps23 Pro-64 3,4-dihydroxylase Tpa1-like proline 4-hydroxylase
VGEGGAGTDAGDRLTWLDLPDTAVSCDRRFREAKPFPHIVLDGVLRPRAVDDLTAAFPPSGWDGWTSFHDTYQPWKHFCEDLRRMPEALADVIREMSEPRFLKFVEQTTGIEKLVPDPYLIGGGLHLSTEGGVLRQHTDFHNHRLDLYRRINALLYLNPEWQDGDGGELCLYDGADPDAPQVVVEPVAGRLVLFETSDRSVHGFPNPVGAGKQRRSIALYYYSAIDDPSFAGDSNTFWRTHADQATLGRRAQLATYRSLLQMSRAFSHLAHRAHPELRNAMEHDKRDR